jgi:predicted ribosome-associated RNA-binding protein Tma20
MKLITKHFILLLLVFSVYTINAQDSTTVRINTVKIDSLIKQKEEIEKQEREFLKQEVEAVNQRLEKGEITQVEAEQLKKDYAKKRALNIENRLAIIDNKIALLERNEDRFYRLRVIRIFNKNWRERLC